MEIFFSDQVSNSRCTLSSEESCHCIKVLRHKVGDEIIVIDGKGTMLRSRITSASYKSTEAEIVERIPNWGSHPYRLTMAVCPTKNIDRYEWFIEKGTEFGMDYIVPTIGERSERRVLKTERLSKILISAAKQSLKGATPNISEPTSVSDFILSQKDSQTLKLICYCFEDESHPRRSIKQALAETTGNDIVVLIGPEGDFSPKEAELAIENGFIPVHLGDSRLRTETAALAAVSAVYFHFSE